MYFLFPALAGQSLRPCDHRKQALLLQRAHSFLCQRLLAYLIKETHPSSAPSVTALADKSMEKCFRYHIPHCFKLLLRNLEPETHHFTLHLCNRKAILFHPAVILWICFFQYSLIWIVLPVHSQCFYLLKRPFP